MPFIRSPYDYRLRKYFYRIRERANARKIPFSLTISDYAKLRKDWKCHYCGSIDKFSVDRKDNNIGYQFENVVACCHSCNTLKSNLFTEDEMFKILDFIKSMRESK